MCKAQIKLLLFLYPGVSVAAALVWALLGRPETLLVVFLFLQNTALVVLLLHTKERVDTLYDEDPEDDDDDTDNTTHSPSGTLLDKPNPEQWNEDML